MSKESAKTVVITLGAGLLAIAAFPFLAATTGYVLLECRRNVLLRTLRSLPDYRLFRHNDTGELVLARKVGGQWLNALGRRFEFIEHTEIR